MIEQRKLDGHLRARLQSDGGSSNQMWVSLTTRAQTLFEPESGESRGNSVVRTLTPNLAMDSWHTPGEEESENACVAVQNPLAGAGVTSFMIEDV